MSEPVLMIKDKKRAGRRKTELKYIEKDSSRQVTFSKRKLGLFKKAGHLSIMSEEAEVAVLILSGKGKPYSFGSPSADKVVERYLNGGRPVEEARGMWWWLEAVEEMGEEDLVKYRGFLENMKGVVEQTMNMHMQQQQLISYY